MPGSAVTLTQAQADALRTLAPNYSKLHLQPTGGGMLASYGPGPVVVPSDADRDTRLALGAAPR
jgi:hypothetical protein